MLKVYLGIDVGKAGALAVLETNDDRQNLVKIVPFDRLNYINALLNVVNISDKIACCVERVGAMPGQGVKSMFSFGENYGFIQGILEAHGIPYETVPPQKWKKEFSLGKDKKASIETAKRLFPSVSLKPTERCKVDNDGMAEALLIAEYCRRKNK